MGEVVVEGRKIAFEAQPEKFDPAGIALVMIPGSGGDRDDWRAQLDGLSNRATVVALELPGHGQSDPPGESSVDRYVEFVESAVAAMGLQQVVVVGCSLGSAIAQVIGYRAPDWLVGLGLVGAGARLRVHPSFLEGLQRDAPQALRLLAQYALAESPNERLLSKVTEKFLAGPPGVVLGDLSACNDFDFTDRITRISLPTIIVVGEQDRLTPVKYSSFLNEQIPQSELHIIPDAGHLVMMEQPAAFNRYMAAFLARVAG